MNIIFNFLQVLPPTDQKSRSVSQYCSYDDLTFQQSINRLGEDSQWSGVKYEMWGEVPLQRERYYQCITEYSTEQYSKVQYNEIPVQYSNINE